MTIRLYDPEKDYAAACRIWRESGWMTQEQEDKGLLKCHLESSRSWVADVDDVPESLVITSPGAVRYLDEDLDFCCLTGVTTSRVARKRGLATRLTARAVADGAVAGALVAGLGMFEEGFYSRLGFGTGGYEVWKTFDPAQLRVVTPQRDPKRISPEDWQAVHASLLARSRGHGGCNLTSAGITRASMLWATHCFGLGFWDSDHHEITHHLWCSMKDVDQGPYHVDWLAYRTREQLLELLGVIRSLGDQLHSIRMREPHGVQMQDLLREPFRHRRMTEKSKHAGRSSAWAYWQMRILDLPACLARTHLPAAEAVRFNLALTDPIESFLPAAAPWRGLAGRYVVTLGRESRAQPAEDADLPTLSASVGAFTRLWLGVRPATGLAVTEEFTAPPDLLAALDRPAPAPAAARLGFLTAGWSRPLSRPRRSP